LGKKPAGGKYSPVIKTPGGLKEGFFCKPVLMLVPIHQEVDSLVYSSPGSNFLILRSI
jgi:hypothetical protein